MFAPNQKITIYVCILLDCHSTYSIFLISDFFLNISCLCMYILACSFIRYALIPLYRPIFMFDFNS